METKHIVINKKVITASSLLWLLAVLLSTSCKTNKPEEIQAIFETIETPSRTSKDLITLVTDSGITLYRLETPELLDFDKKEEPYTECPSGIHVTFFKDSVTIQADIKSNYAKNLTQKKLLELRNNVKAMNQKGEIFNTELLYWDQEKHRIYTDNFVKITTKTEIITGYGFESNEDFTDYTLKKISGDIELTE